MGSMDDPHPELRRIPALVSCAKCDGTEKPHLLRGGLCLDCQLKWLTDAIRRS